MTRRPRSSGPLVAEAPSTPFPTTLSPEDVARCERGEAVAVPFLDRTDGLVRVGIVASGPHRTAFRGAMT